MKAFHDLSTKAFYAVLLATAALISSMAFSSDIQKMMMRRFHWRDTSFLHWSALQFVPSMYNFSNRIELSPGISSLQVNHFPMRVITFNPKTREQLAVSEGPYRVTLSSHYRSTQLETIYELDRQPPYLIFRYADKSQNK